MKKGVDDLVEHLLAQVALKGNAGKSFLRIELLLFCRLPRLFFANQMLHTLCIEAKPFSSVFSCNPYAVSLLIIRYTGNVCCCHGITNRSSNLVL